MPGRLPKPVAVIEAEGNKGRYTKAELERRKELEITPANDNINCPKWLKGEGKKEWDRIVDELKELGLLTNLDVASLAICCDAYGKYVVATRQIKQKELLIEYVNAARQTNKVTNPLIQIATKYADMYKKYMIEFGLSPSARARLVSATRTEEDEEDDDLLD
ncbi:P27 family predicted phage terminase small subunit [Evansella vedderi]|uniref:P27 family predicted phage terminase small subunit n=1 Tax=Evansella vedderi TaxID=38282 RepID=A0ABU0A4I5_9BACI|nr:phage terminase small subunit P27 family [Evansella vedderi]MDQ0257937.1 P27 family predicted phage terminase small subunit [Evansella vedderi]